MFLDQMDLIEQANFLESYPEVRILVVEKDDDFRHDLNDPICDYRIDFSTWQKEFEFQKFRFRSPKNNIIIIALLTGNGEYLGFEKIIKRQTGGEA